jgi:DNA polymerase-3 subunit delta'
MYTRQLQELGYTDTNIALAAELTDSLPVADTWLADDWFNQSVITISEITGKLLQLDVEAFNLVQTDIMKLSSGTSSHQLLVHMLAAAWRDVILSASNALDTPHFKQSHEWGQYAQRYPMAKLLAVQRIIFTANETLAMNVNLQTTMESVILESQFELGGK